MVDRAPSFGVWRRLYMIIDQVAITRLLPVPDCIVEERMFVRGAEVVSHVNFTQLDRVRSRRPVSRDGSASVLPEDRWAFPLRVGGIFDTAEAFDFDAMHQPALTPTMVGHDREQPRRDRHHAQGQR